jgi:hypothetical protein
VIKNNPSPCIAKVPDAPVFDGGTSRPDKQIQLVYDLAGVKPKQDVETGVLPSPRLNVIGTRNETDFGAQWLACMKLPVERSRQQRYRLRPFEEG